MKKAQKNDFAYYQVENDLKAYPDAWCYAIVGGRNTGKTYGGLSYFMKEKQPITYCKRTNEDVDVICSGNNLGQKAGSAEVDFSPYKSINRDKGTNVKAYKIRSGLGGFYNTKDGEASGLPVSYLVSLNAVQKIKGFDLSDSEALMFDEFIPQPWERISRNEGEQLMDLYKTIARDRVLRGRGELKLILFANAVNVWNPTCDILELTDTIAEMSMKGREVYYDKERGIFIRILKTSRTMMDAESETGMYKAMSGTKWGRMAFGNEFGYNDFSKVKKMALKGFRGVASVAVKGKPWYIYYNDEKGWYVCKSRHDRGKCYDLDVEYDQKAFYLDIVIDVMNAGLDGLAWFETYAMYDLFTNFKRRYQVK